MANRKKESSVITRSDARNMLHKCRLVSVMEEKQILSEAEEEDTPTPSE